MKTRSHFQRISSLFKGATLSAIALVSFVSPAARAESHTNAVLQATFALTSYIQESQDTNNPVWTTSSRSFGNSDIINAIATDFGLPASDYTSNSLVLLSTDVATTNSHLRYALRSTSDVGTDISTNLAIKL